MNAQAFLRVGHLYFKYLYEFFYLNFFNFRQISTFKMANFFKKNVGQMEFSINIETKNKSKPTSISCLFCLSVLWLFSIQLRNEMLNAKKMWNLRKIRWYSSSIVIYCVVILDSKVHGANRNWAIRSVTVSAYCRIEVIKYNYWFYILIDVDSKLDLLCKLFQI